MKKVILTLVSLIFFNAIYAQKVKFKKDKIEVDKKELFEFLKTKDGSIMTDALPNFALRDMKGNDLLIFTDTTIYYSQLPNEEEKRKAYKTLLCTNPSTNKSTMIPRPKAFNFRKYIVRNLEELGFFKTNEFTTDTYESLISKQDLSIITKWNEHIDSTNTNRLKNYDLTKNKFGELESRKPGRISVVSGKIKDGDKEVGEFKVKTKGSYAHIYEIINKEGYTIGSVSLEQKNNKGNVKPFVTDEPRWFYYKKDKEGNDLKPDAKLYNMAKYLIEQGYL